MVALCFGIVCSVAVGPPGSRLGESALWGTRVAGAQVRDMRTRWLTVRSPHFSVHYHEPLGAAARRVLEVAERAQAILAPELGHTPKRRTVIALTDGTDNANGSAQVLPYNAIRLFVTAPDDLSPLATYDDWLSMLTVHEHAHVVHLDTIGGIPAIINAVFGKLAAPNALEPRWLIEGLAVHEESAHTTAGRLRSSIFDMYLRADALADRMPDLDQLSHDVLRWPHGTLWYLYGSHFMHYITEQHGEQVLADISRYYGSRIIPYGLNRACKRATGFTFVELYEQFRKDQRERATGLERRVRSEGAVEGTRLTFHGEQAGSPRFLPGGNVIYWVADGKRRGQIRQVDVAQARLQAPGDLSSARAWLRGKAAAGKRLARVNGRGSASWAGNGRYVFFSGEDAGRNLYYFHDLYRHDRATGRTQRLTQGLRAREPDVSPDGQEVAFVVSGAGTSHLAVGPTRTPEQYRVRFRNARFDQVYTPRWSPDGTQIAFSAWSQGGFRDLWVLDVESGATRRITRDRFFDSGPTWSPDGRWLLFSSDASGVPNVHGIRLDTGQEYQVTHVVTGAFQPDVSRDGKQLVYLGYTTHGFDLFTMGFEPKSFRVFERRPNSRTAQGDDGRNPTEVVPLAVPTRDLEVAGAYSRVSAYNPVSTLLPRAYFLDLTQAPVGTQLGVSVTGADIVGYNGYSGRVGFGLDRAEVDAELTWNLYRSPVPLEVNLFRFVSPRNGLIVENEGAVWYQETAGARFRLRFPWLKRFSNQRFEASYLLQHVGQARPFGGSLDPNDHPPTLPQLGFQPRVTARWTYSRLLRTRYDVSNSEGLNASLGTAVASPVVGADHWSWTLSGYVEGFVENPWVERHVLATRYTMGTGRAESGHDTFFGVGGFGQQDVVSSLSDLTFFGGVALRGYPPFHRVGTQYHLVQMEYRAPLMQVDRGLGTLPVYLNRVWGLAFADVGDAFEQPQDARPRVGAGAELLTEFTMGYYIPFTLRLGLARGLGSGGETQVYVNLGTPF